MAKAIPFATDAWIKQLGAECNKSKAYREAAKNWEGDFYFIVEPDEQGQEPIYMYMDLYHGQCRQAYLAEDSSALDPEFRIRGPMRVWQEIAQRKIDPVKALVTRQLSVQGNMAKIMRNVRAANELVNCTTRVDTKFPVD
ncbi:MAG: SCP2 sterol-binding domain-containing protein [Anaerolineae bacterium]|jgi:putative sterol carrier protein|nr:SCP2 sterol-binding domain-containing protein [Anaerolineae bacterium]